MFQRIFHKSHTIFTAFTNIGHYVHSIDKYQSVVDMLNALPVSVYMQFLSTFNHSETFSV